MSQEQLGFLSRLSPHDAATEPEPSVVTAPIRELPTIAPAAAPSAWQPRWPSLEATQEAVKHCTACRLCEQRTQTVFYDGNPRASVMLIGEGPGQNEDETGIPFVGRAGQLLTQILASVHIDRQQDIYICNIVKCRPPQNRAPLPDEMATCFDYLKAQIYFVRPHIILLAGATALKGILNIQTGITKVRGQWLDTPYHGAKAMAIFHPSYLLRNQSKAEGSPRWLMWQDIQAIRRAMENLAPQ